jgi:hypothetical protein
MRIAVLVAALVASTSIAAAQAPGQTMSWDPEVPPPAAAPVRVEPTTVSYRGQIITADVASFGLMLVGPLVDDNEPDLSGIGFAGYFLAAPLVHAAHGRGGAAVKSLGLRIGLPFLGGLVGYRLGPDDMACVQAGTDGRAPHGGCGDHGSLIGLLLGAAAGAGTAMYVDAKYLSHYETTRVVTWSAGIAPTRGGAALSFSGSF